MTAFSESNKVEGAVTEHRLTFLALALLSTFACGREGQKAEADAAPVPVQQATIPALPREVPNPDLGSFDPLVAEALRAARQELDTARAAGRETEVLAGLSTRMGQLYQAYDLLEPAAACFENARFWTPGALRPAHLLGLARQRQGRLEEATAAFEAAQEIERSAAGLWRLGEVLRARGRESAARSALDAAIALDPTCLAARYELGQLELTAGRAEAAAALFQEVLRAQPSATQAHFPLGQALKRLGREAEARVQLEKAAARQQSIGGRARCADRFEAELGQLMTGAAALIQRGVAAKRAGNRDLAVEEFRRAIAAAPGDPVAHQALARTLAEMGRFAEAAPPFRQALALDPTSVERRTDLAIVLENLQQNAEALGLYRSAIKEQPENLPARLGVARLLIATKDPAGALREVDEVLRRNPQHLQARGLRGSVLAMLGRGQEAQQELARLVDDLPANAVEERLNLAWGLALMGDNDRAKRHLRRVAENAKVDPRVQALAYFRLGTLAARANDPAGARAELERALTLDPTLDPAKQLMAQLR